MGGYVCDTIFDDLKNMKVAIIEKYGCILRDCLERMAGCVSEAILLFVLKYYNELPMPMEKEIRNGIAEYAGVNPATFQIQLSKLCKSVEAKRKHEPKDNNTIPKKPHVILIKKEKHENNC
jgi:hypothetical protein